MAEDHLKRTASFRSSRDEPSFEEDPLIELARIVAEDGGFRRHRTPELRPARNEPGRYNSSAREEAIASQLEAELLQQWEADDGGSGLPPPRPVTDLHAPGGAGPAQPAHVPLRSAAGVEDRQPTRFPEIVIEDARPAAAAVHAQHGDWRQQDQRPRQEVTEPFEEELHALFSGPEALPGTQAGDHPDEEDASAISFSGYEESYGESYSAEIDDSDDLSEPASEEDGFFAEEEAGELAAVRPEPARRGRSYKGLIAAVGVVGVVILGGAVAALVGGMGAESDSGPPPVIRAEAGPVKVEPEETAEAQTGDGAGQAVYDRVAGRAPKSEEKLVDRAEEPRQVSRVVLPQTAGGSQADSAESAAAGGGPDTELAPSQPDGGQAEGSIAASISSETATMESGPRIDPVGPRRVRTVTVRPDGSIAPAPVRVAEAASEPQGRVETDFEAPDPVAVRTVRIEDDGQEPSRALRTEPAESQSEPAASPRAFAPVADNAQPESAAPAGAAATGAADAGDGTDAAAPSEEQVAMVPRARPGEVPAAFLRPAAAQTPEPERVASLPAAGSRNGQPVDLLATGPASPRPQAEPSQPRQQAARPAAASSPYAVQLSAQRSEDQARSTFASLRNRFPSILGGQEAQIERADLGERGIYYRVRVGAGSQAEAAQLCEQLKAAGGSCFVTR